MCTSDSCINQEPSHGTVNAACEEARAHATRRSPSNVNSDQVAGTHRQAGRMRGAPRGAPLRRAPARTVRSVSCASRAPLGDRSRLRALRKAQPRTRSTLLVPDRRRRPRRMLSRSTTRHVGYACLYHHVCTRLGRQVCREPAAAEISSAYVHASSLAPRGPSC